jgi:hypothetical protein
MPGSYPNGENKPISITNFDTREPIGAGTMQAWGYLEYVQPLTEKQLSDYELRKPPVQHFKKEQAAIACPAKEVEVVHGKKTSVMDNLRKKQALISGQAKPELMPNKRSGDRVSNVSFTVEEQNLLLCSRERTRKQCSKRYCK